ncbi:MAG: RHS repeat-associated core domain-containing protein, partial [Acidobacteriota bacterium]|nr:RHS repeat-associated core domain-containing protein [Acidobacteriota bacterium]
MHPYYATENTYHPNGMLKQVTHARRGEQVSAGVAERIDADPNAMGRPYRVYTDGATFPGATSGLEGDWSNGYYSYDGAGNIKKLLKASDPLKLGDDTFTYDKVSRLTQAKVATGVSTFASQDYAYDAWGNLTSYGGQPRAVVGTTNHLDDASYDAAGNQTGWLWNPGLSRYTYIYGYDRLNQLRYVNGPDGQHRVLAYDASGERIVERNLTGGTTTFNLRGLDGALLREVELKAGAYEWVKDYIYRDGLLLASQHRTEGHQHYHLDHPGTTRMLTNRCGERVKRYEQFPYGDTISAPANDTETRRFTGHQRDLGSPTNTTDDLEYMHARYYGVKMGRLLSVDPALELKKSKRQPQRWNGYAYVLGNPLVFTDPTGELVYVVIYTQGNSVGDDEFKRAALTRANEIRKEKGFDPEKDTVLVQGVTTKADFAGVIDQANGLADTYGQVKEVSLYSHAGPQHGPTFHGSSWRFFTGQELDTLKVNWAPGASAHFYGCNTGQNFSAAFAASQHVTTYGQPRYSYFSGSPSERIPIAPRGPVYLYPAPLSGRATHTTSAMITRGRRRGCGNGGASGASSAVSTAGM